ncbi:hypothetical protein C5N14_00855 [Micromonospora sp. MW-13]|uniref:hypothetical protein n=1 Tax=Micromonospora sp. MW-13 TaxID=2094022 RepID=UPI000E42E072|nr:hypothetical protein [Micromonospora sp. MW-13]RGC71037.1 hypothetical protein C5N14_00855 [Micromonospora sp. MW-13]
MTVPAERVRQRPALPGRVLPLLLVVTLLAPVAFLFVQQRRLTDDDRGLAVRERMGVEYLRALGPVTLALIDAQSAAVAGRTASGEALNRAVEDAASVDTRVGDQLRAHDRWTGLRAKLEALPDRTLTDPEAAFVAYGEVTDLLLALHRKVREGSGLMRDPKSDSFFLQDAVSDELPEALVAAGRLADLATLAARRPAAERIRTVSELAALRVAALGPATELVTNLRAAVDSTESTKLGANVLTPLDNYQRAVERLAALSAPTGRAGTEGAPGAGGPADLTTARDNAQSAARQLQPVILDELDVLLRERIDRLDRERWLAGAAAGAAVLLVAALGAALLAAYRRAGWRAVGEHRADADAGASPGGTGWQPPGEPRGPAPLGTLAPAEPRTLQPAGQGRATDAERWEPFDAAR